MAARLKDETIEKKLRDADRAMECFFECLNGLGGTAKPRISLLIDKAGEDGKGNTWSL